ncbi:uncharacterized protein LOC116223797 [Clupea harengus]|uniref:Uncharacterized protein LOC116223797 n=1 Tax=Clupea harengus TaxID=7950 RepID=A0A8M1KTS7_CLUHA|nr:uncharacterized protein LOC116223797 [Clupea harengus]
MLHDTVTLTCNKFCSGPRTWNYNDDPVTPCEADRCKEGNGFENRVRLSNESFQGNYSLDLIIILVEFNDQGSYVGTCDGQHFDFKLEVLVPITVNTSTGDNVTIPCYATSPKSEGCYVLWEKNGEPVLKLEDGVLTPGPTLKDRASVSQDGCEKGDLSLRIAGVLPSDQGLYLCQYSKTRDTDQFRGAPNSARLNVQRANDNGETCSCDTLQNIAIFVPVCLVLIIIIAILVWWKCPCKARTIRPPDGFSLVPPRDDRPTVPVECTVNAPASGPGETDDDLPLPEMDTNLRAPVPWTK